MPIISYNKEVAKKLTFSQWSMFMEKAFPELKRDYDSLQKSLESNEWEQVKILSHKIKGIVGLLGMNELLDDLFFITQLDKKQLATTTYQTLFKERYSAYLSAWESDWIASIKHK